MVTSNAPGPNFHLYNRLVCTCAFKTHGFLLCLDWDINITQIMDLRKGALDIGNVIVFERFVRFVMISFLCSDINLNESFMVVVYASILQIIHIPM